MKKWMSSLLGLCLAFSFSCSDPEGPVIPPKHYLDEEMSDELFEFFNSLPIANITIEDVLLPCGMKVVDFMRLYQRKLSKIATEDEYRDSDVNIKNHILGSFSDRGIFLTERSNFIYYDEGENKPAQVGLAYVWGGKSVNRRTKGVHGSSCTDSLYGLDCSGYMYQLFQHARLNLMVGTANSQRDVATIQRVLAAGYPDARFTVRDLGQIPLSEFVSGDIVYWVRKNATSVHHIGMVLDTEDGLFLAHSRGGPHRCDFNKTFDGGPVLQELNVGINPASRTEDYGIVRIDVTDPWTLRLKCAARDYDNLSTTISIPATTDFSDEVYVLGIDYDGRPLDILFRLQYNSDTHILDFRYSLLSGSRVDLGQFDLSLDDTGYVDLDQIVVGGCDAQIRLVRGSRNRQNNLDKVRRLGDEYGYDGGVKMME